MLIKNLWQIFCRITMEKGFGVGIFDELNCSVLIQILKNGLVLGSPLRSRELNSMSLMSPF